jgi:DNA-directed RNA polymerase beta subunit
MGSFVINGIERVIVAQLIRSYGVFIASEEAKGREFYGAKDNSGSWSLDRTTNDKRQ